MIGKISKERKKTMSIRNNYSYTMGVCCAGYVTQALAVNFAPLLFLTFRRSYGITLPQISFMVVLAFFVQMLVDLLSIKYINKIGYRKAAIIAHTLAAVGFICLGFLPDIMNNHYAGIMIACFIYSCGGGLLEVLISPIAEACPTKNKEAAMSFLHSFYSWGSVIVILGSTIFFYAFGIDNWRMLSCIWALVPVINGILFTLVPINDITQSEEKLLSLGDLFKNRLIYLIVVLMIASGASELAMAQWVSAFVESGLGVSKTIGDVLGPCLFAVMMGLSRILYSSISRKVEIINYIIICCVICIIAYLLATLFEDPVIALIGCAFVGFSVGIFWPGTISYAAKRIPLGGAALFSLMACCGDIGCTIGPAFVGFVSKAFNDNLKIGLLWSTIFPIILLILCLYTVIKKRKD